MVMEGETIPAIGHSAVEWNIEIEPTVDAEGLRSAVCEVCGETFSEVIAPIGGSVGLEFLSNGDGTCTLVSVGSFDGEDLYVPEISPDNETVIAIEKNAFANCDAIISVYLPDSLTKIGKDAFAFCTGLTRIEIPSSVTEIHEGAFWGCEGLKVIEISQNVEYIGFKAFSPAHIRRLTIDAYNPTYFIENNCLIDRNGMLIMGFGDFKIPSGVVSVIYESAFEGNQSVVSVEIPKSVSIISARAFAETSVETVNVGAGTVEIMSDAFASCDQLRTVTLPNTMQAIGARVFDGCSMLSEIQFLGSVEEWNRIEVDWDNDGLFSAKMSFLGDVPADEVYGYGRTTISGNAAMLYDLLEELVLSESLYTTCTFEAAEKIDINDFYLARMMFFSDHPEVFWWDGGAEYSQGSDGYLRSIELEYAYSAYQVQQMKAELEAVIDEILAGMPDSGVLDQVLYLHDAVAERVTYTFTDNDQNPYGALVEGKAVCNGYATSYQLLLQRVGIRAWTVNGTAGGENHAWNVVWLSDDVCVYTDVTWNDQEYLMHYYFNMSLEEIDDDHYFNSEFVLPKCDHTEYSFNDAYDECNVLNEYDSADVLASFLEFDSNGNEVAVFYYDGDDFSYWLSKNSYEISAILGEAQISYYNIGDEYAVTFIRE